MLQSLRYFTFSNSSLTDALFLLLLVVFSLSLYNLLLQSIGLLKKVKTIDCSGLINTCMELIMVAVSMQQRAQPQAAAGKK